MKGFGKQYYSKNKKKSNPTKEQIIQQAIQFHAQGKISEAEKYYHYCINQGI